MHNGIRFLLILSFWFVCALGSKGNQQPIFLQCVDRCSDSQCPTVLPLPLRLLFWSCRENCQYNCMHAITDKAIEKGDEVMQYFGKWPFHRWLGIQEPASVLFSIGNGLIHYHYYHVLQQRIPNNYYLKKPMLVYALLGMNAWVWSTVFHARDTPVTEKLDYFSAGLLILYSLYYALRRLLYIRHTPWLMAVVFIGCYTLHVSYLSLVRFDYGYNMLASVVVGLIQLSLWVGWSIRQYTTPRRSFAHMAFFSVVGVAIAMSLELLDFPPIGRALDAHSLWHLSTIPLMVLWYKFVLVDTQYEMKHHKTAVTMVSSPKWWWFIC